MTADPHSIADASALAWERLVGAVPGAWVRRHGGAIGVVTGTALSGYNGVWGVEAELDVGAVAELLDHVVAAGVPYCMQLRPGWPASVEEVARDHGLRRVEGEPIMVLDHDRRLAGAQAVPGLTLRQLAPAEGGLHATVVAAAFGEPEPPYRQIMSAGVLSTEGMRCYVGEVDGRPVTTCVGVTVGRCVAVFGVATLPGHRRRGYGAAVTARAVSDGLAAGARWAWLSASDSGYGVYSALGFAVVERWDFWESVPCASRPTRHG